MPGAIGFVASLAVNVLGPTGAVILGRLALSAVLSAVSAKLFAPKVPDAVGLSGTSVMTRSSLEHRKIVYGQAAVSGPIYYNNVSGSSNEYLWFGVALCDGESEDLIGVYLDNEWIPMADINWTPGTGSSDGTGTGDVSTSTFIGANSTTAAQIYYYLGDDDQPVSGDLNTAFADIGTNHRLRGITHLVVQLLYNEDTEEVWRAGAPSNIRAVIKGRKIYDPRLDSTNGGAGLHRYTDSTTWEWSDNPALCIADYLMNVMGVAAASAIDWASLSDAADDCDVSVAIPVASTETRFTCNGALSLGSTHRDNLDALLSSMNGTLTYSGGVWRLRAGVWEASSVSFTADDLAGDIEVRGAAPKSERFNAVRGFFIDPNRNYETAEFPHVSDSTYETRDNGESIQYDLSLPMTNTETMAQRIAMRLLEQGDKQAIIKAPVNAKGAQVTVGDTFDWTLDDFSWSAKTFRCIGWIANENGTYTVTGKEDDSTAYTDPIEGDYGTGNTGGITIPGNVVPPPSNLMATGVPFGIQLSWTNPALNEFDQIDIYESATSAWSAATKIASVRGETFTAPHPSGQAYYYWVRARNLAGEESARFPDSDTSTITATASDDGESVQLQGATLSDKLITANDAEVSYRLATTGEEQSYEGDGGTHADIADWLLSGTASDFDARLTVNSGTNPTGDSLATWLGLGTTRTWTLTDTTAGDGVTSNNCTIEIRENASGDVIASATVTMEVEKQEATLSLSGGTYQAYNFAADARLDIRVDDNGNMHRRSNSGSWVQIETSTGWCRPTTEAPGAYEVRYTNATGDTGDLTATSAEDTWYALSSGDWAIWIDDSTTAPGGNTATFDIEIRNGSSGGADVSAQYTIGADREDT